MSKYSHLFFDLDHTLWDFETNSHEALTELYERHDLRARGIDSCTEFISTYKKINEHYWALYSTSQVEKEVLRTVRFQKTLNHFGIEDYELGTKIGDDYIDITPRKPGLLPNTLHVLDTLKERYRLHIITNGFEEVQDVKMISSGLDGYFEKIITSEKVGEKKPHPEVFQFALNSANAQAAESLMIGDNLLADVIGAREIGMDQVYFNPYQVPHKEEVSYEIADLKELLEFL